jgi:hypothetical protein
MNNVSSIVANMIPVLQWHDHNMELTVWFLSGTDFDDFQKTFYAFLTTNIIQGRQ